MGPKPSFIVVDCETTGLHPYRDRLHGFAIALPSGECWYESVPTGISARALALLSDPSIAKVNHNLRFDLKFLRRAGIVVRGRMLCTLQMFKMIDENAPAGLKDLSPSSDLTRKRRLDEVCALLNAKHVGELCRLLLDGPPLEPLTFEEVHDAVSQYCCEDVLNTLSLYRRLSLQFTQLPKETQAHYFNELMPAELCIMEMELRGIGVDLAAWDSYLESCRTLYSECLASLSALWSAEIQTVRESLLEKEKAKRKTEKGKAGVPLPPFNWASNNHVASLIYDVLGYPPSYTDRGNRKVDEAVIRSLAIPNLSEPYAKFQAAKKELTTYAEGFREHVVVGPDGPKIYSNFPQLPVTGRFASSDPNMQNVPRGSGLKRCFVPPPGYVFLYADYSQVELRIAADISQDPVMLGWFRDNIDPHRGTAVAIWGDEATAEHRQHGKNLNFASIFDAGPYRLSEMFAEYGVNFTPDECKYFRTRFFETHHVYRKHLDRIWEEVQRTGFLMAKNGRIRRIPDAQLEKYIDRKKRLYNGPAFEWTRSLYNDEIYQLVTKRIAHAKKQAFNFPVQSPGASITKAAMLALEKASIPVVLTIHDAIIALAPREQAVTMGGHMRHLMETSYKLSVPLKVDLKILASMDEKNLAFDIKD